MTVKIHLSRDMGITNFFEPFLAREIIANSKDMVTVKARLQVLTACMSFPHSYQICSVSARALYVYDLNLTLKWLPIVSCK